MAHRVLHRVSGLGRPEFGPEKPDPTLMDSGCDDRTLYWLGLIVGLVPVVAHFFRGGPWGAEPTIGAALCLFGLHGLLGPRLTDTDYDDSGGAPGRADPPVAPSAGNRSLQWWMSRISGSAGSPD